MFLTTALVVESVHGLEFFISLPPSLTQKTNLSIFLQQTTHHFHSKFSIKKPEMPHSIYIQWHPFSTLPSHPFSLYHFGLHHWTIENQKPSRLWFLCIHTWTQFKPSFLVSFSLLKTMTSSPIAVFGWCWLFHFNFATNFLNLGELLSPF